MAYAAVTCLRTTILRLLNSSSISVVLSTRTTLKLVYEELASLQQVLERSDGSRSRFNDLDRQIIGAAQELEDSLEFHELKQFHSHSQSYGDDELMRHITSSVEAVKKIKQLYKRDLDELLPEEEEADDDDNIDYDDDHLLEEEEEDDDDDDDDDEEEEGVDGNDFSCNMVGLSKQCNEIMQCIVDKSTNYVFSIVGMAGIGKTALAERIFHDPFIVKKFKFRAFFRIGRNYELEELKQSILAQANPSNDKLGTAKDERLDEYLEEYLDDKRYLIVLDDVWSLDFWYDYFKDRRRRDKAKGSRILLTTRLEDLVSSLGGNYCYFLMPFLDEVESWDLLRREVFAANVCPPELEESGKKIAEKCDGLPLVVVTVAAILSKAETSTTATTMQEYWKEAAHDMKSEVFKNAYDEILQVLYPSYDNLPPQAKPCFLYMGAFPPNHEVRRSKLVNLWCIEGFLEPKKDSVKAFASECFDKLIRDRVVVPSGQLSSDGQNYQACSLHSVFRHLCNKEVENNEFLLIIQSYEEEGGERSKQQRRVSIHNNVLMSNRDLYASMEYSSTRSLLCTGAYHKYEVPVNFTSLSLLRVCDALTIRFYEYPLEVLELVQLRYFAITCNQNLPPCVSKLWKLEYLIVDQHLSINTTLAETFLPVEVWDLQELIHLQITGRNLPNPPSGVKLEKLVKLLDVGTYTCSEAVLTSIPNLEKLRVQIELTPNSAEPAALSYLDHISQLLQLASLQCVIVNPILMSEINVAARPSLSSVSSSSITKLTLSGLGYPWKYLNKFLKLPHLRVLKLLCHAFRGEKWEVEENGFLKLECLSIEDSDLVQWQVGEGTFPCLSHLNLKFCYKLQQLRKISSYLQIELIDCNSVAVSCAEQMGCYVFSSWDAAREERDARASQNDISHIYKTIYQYYDE